MDHHLVKSPKEISQNFRNLGTFKRPCGNAIMKISFLLVLSAFLFCSCMGDRNNAKLVQESGENAMISGIDFIPMFIGRVSAPRITISAFIDEDPLHRKVQLSGFINDRYFVLIDFSVRFSVDGGLHVENFSQPKIVINELSEITELNDGRFRLMFSNNYKVDKDQASRFLFNQVTLDELLKDIVEEQPGIVGFSEYIRWRDSREE